MEKFKYLAKSKISKFPKTPGVYALKKGRRFLYIGKAQNLRNRVKQHKDVLGLAEHIAYIKTGSEIEALILEAKLIKKHQPKFNVMWRDDKNYFYICITKEDFPKVFITHQIKSQISNLKSQNYYLGPFVDGTALKQTLKILRKVFPYRTCKRLPKKPCLWYQLQRCPAPCLVTSQVPGFKEKIKRECRRNARNLMKILQGKKNQVLKNLKKEMMELAKEEKFEEAEKIKNQVEALEKVMSHARIFELVETRPLPTSDWPYKRIEAYDISNIQGHEATGSMVVFTNGLPDKSQYRKFKIRITKKPNDVAMLKEVLSRRFQHPEWEFPDFILIDGGKAQLNTALKVKSQISKIKNKIKKSKITALAKKRNELFIEGKRKPILLKSLPRETFNLILQLRDEAHRFARAYHHHLRKKGLFS